MNMVTPSFLLYHSRLKCSENTAALLASYIVQGKLVLSSFLYTVQAGLHVNRKVCVVLELVTQYSYIVTCSGGASRDMFTVIVHNVHVLM